MKNRLSGFLLTILALLVVDRRASSKPHHDFAGLVPPCLAYRRQRGRTLRVGRCFLGRLDRQTLCSHLPRPVVGIVDGATEFFQETLTPEQWADWMQLIRQSRTADNEVPDYESSVTHIRNVLLVRIIPSVVLTSDKPWDLRVGTTGSSFPAWLAAQERLAAQLNARHITQTNSSHGIAVVATSIRCGCCS